jgi:peroxiredoxin
LGKFRVMRKLAIFFLLAGAALQAFPQATDEYAADLQSGAAAATGNKFNAIGSWRGVFELRPGIEVPFNFEIKNGRDNSPELYFRNDTELFDGGRVRETTDSLFIPLNQFDNELAFQINGEALSGVLRRQDGSGQPLALTATPATNWRFRESSVTPAGDISGTYAVTFTGSNGREEKTVGIFRQQGARLTATFLRVTGDSRYLEGTVEADSFRLSGFIGSGPSFYIGVVGPDGNLSGQSVGVRGGTPFIGIRDPNAKLPDAYSLTYLREGYTSLDFSFPDADGHAVSLKDPKYRDKVVVVAIGGTWCPNCIDETAFLAPWYRANRSRGIEVISIQYERQTDPAFVHKVLTRNRQRYDIQYDQLFGGINDKQAVVASLPALNTFLAFPTTIFIDRQGKVAKIHTGFAGPATGKYYDEFIKEFNEEVDNLLKQ